MSVGWKAHLYNLRLHHHHTVCNSRGNPDNAGNSRAKGIVDNAGNSRGNPDNAGNINCGRQKKSAGRRSGVKRCAKFALVVKKYWLDKIFAREKDWEIRSCSTARRGLIHFAQSKAGGTLVGRARLVDCQELDQATFLQNIARHHVPHWSMVPYKRVFAWVLQDAQRYAQPLHHEHEKGAVIWVKTWGKDQTRKRKGEDKKTAKPEVLIESPAPQIGQC